MGYFKFEFYLREFFYVLVVLSPIFPQIVFVFSYLRTRLFGTYWQSELDFFLLLYSRLSYQAILLSKEKDSQLNLMKDLTLIQVSAHNILKY